MSVSPLERPTGLGLSIQEARALIPEGREPYVIAREALRVSSTELSEDDEQFITDKVSHAIKTLHLSRDTLRSPLTEELASAVESMAAQVDPDEGPDEDFNPLAAYWLLQAVYEHGYRSDGA